MFAFPRPCVSERGTNGGNGKIRLTLDDVGRVRLVRVTLLCDGDLFRDLDKVNAGGEIRDAA